MKLVEIYTCASNFQAKPTEESLDCANQLLIQAKEQIAVARREYPDSQRLRISETLSLFYEAHLSFRCAAAYRDRGNFDMGLKHAANAAKLIEKLKEEIETYAPDDPQISLLKTLVPKLELQVIKESLLLRLKKAETCLQSSNSQTRPNIRDLENAKNELNLAQPLLAILETKLPADENLLKMQTEFYLLQVSLAARFGRAFRESGDFDKGLDWTSAGISLIGEMGGALLPDDPGISSRLIELTKETVHESIRLHLKAAETLLLGSAISEERTQKANDHLSKVEAYYATNEVIRNIPFGIAHSIKTLLLQSFALLRSNVPTRIQLAEQKTAQAFEKLQAIDSSNFDPALMPVINSCIQQVSTLRLVIFAQKLVSAPNS